MPLITPRKVLLQYNNLYNGPCLGAALFPSMTPQEYYSQETDKRQAQAADIQRRVNNYSRIRLAVGVLFLLSLYFASTQTETLYQLLPPILCIAAFLFVVRRHLEAKEMLKEALTYISVLQNEQEALRGNYKAFIPGNEFVNPAHPYAYDFDIFGDVSVFRMLCRTVTHNGYQTLAKLIKEPYTDAKELIERQEAIAELALKPELLQRFRVTGITAGEEGANDKELLLSWLVEADKFRDKKLLHIAAWVMPLAAILAIILSFVTGGIHPFLLWVLAVNWLILGTRSKQIKATYNKVGRALKAIDKYGRLAYVISEHDFKSVKPANAARVTTSGVTEVGNFAKLVHLFDNRANGMVGPLLNSFFLFDIYCLLRLEGWRSKNRELLPELLQEVEDFDVYVSLATYAFNKPANIYPSVNTGSLVLQATDLKHPLILETAAVGNDFGIGANEQFYLLTGANMTGKSTFIRTIGVNMVMAYMGLPVPAKSMDIPLVKIFTAIRITDSVQEDVSYFKAELNRLRQIMDVIAHDEPYMVMLDEPLRGTNSTDKQSGTRALVNRLVKHNAIGIVATHDTGLCDMEAPGSGIANYHFESTVTDGGIAFDYKLKRGCSTSNNATILMRMMDII